jgi:hypothetical protein
LSDNCDENVNITGLCRFLPLSSSAWIEAMGGDFTLRPDTKEDIIKAGFDVHATAEWLQEFYRSISE